MDTKKIRKRAGCVSVSQAKKNTKSGLLAVNGS